MVDIHSHSFALIPKKVRYIENLIKQHLIESTEEGNKFYYEETNDYWIVPRYYPQWLKETYRINDFNIIYHNVEAQPIDFECSIEPRDDDQKYAIQFLSDPTQRFGILRARPGFGKTICAIKAIHQLKEKTLIVVHKEKLALQWIERFQQFTDIKDIPLFAGNLNKDKLMNMKVGIAIIHTLANRYLSRNLEYHKIMKEAGIGTIIFDECHVTIPTPYFQKGQGLLYANRYLGLSATPFRDNDIKTNIIYYNLSNKIYDTGDYDLKPIIYEVFFTSQIPEKTKRWITWNNKYIHQRYLKKAIQDPIYIDLIIKLIHQALKDNRNILLLAPNKQVLQTIGSLLNKDNITDIGYFWAGQSKDELNHQIILATSQIFKEGLDVPRLDTLIVLDQIGAEDAIEQMIGRILRQHQHKKQPKVVFLNDNNFDIHRFIARKRMKIYNNKGFQFKSIEI